MALTIRSIRSIAVAAVLLTSTFVVANAAAADDPPPVTRITAPGGVQPNDNADRPMISADGTKVAFDSEASNLVPGDTNGVRDIFVWDSTTGAVVRVAPPGVQPNGLATLVHISGDGNWVSYESRASNLVPDGTNQRVVYRTNLATGATERVSIKMDGGIAGASRPTMSFDGRFVAFNSTTPVIVPGDTNMQRDVFVRDMNPGGETIRVSVNSDGVQGNGLSLRPEMSHDGNVVAFVSDATNLYPGDTNGFRDIFVRDIAAGTTELVSITDTGGFPNEDSGRPMVSPDGRYVAFGTEATNMLQGQSMPQGGLFVYDRVTKTNTVVSLRPDGSISPATNSRPVLSRDATFVAFNSTDQQLVPGDTGNHDTFVRDLVNGVTYRVSIAQNGGSPNGFSYRPEISEDGSTIVYRSAATNLVPNDTNGEFDLFVAELDLNPQDIEDPAITVNTPTRNQVLPGSFTVAGSATDDVSVQQVRVGVRNMATAAWLQPNGTFAASFHLFDAQLAAPGSTSTDWSLPVVLPPGGTYSVNVRAVDGVGNISPPPRSTRFITDASNSEPQTAIDSPARNQVLTGSAVTVTGTASDDASVDRVVVAIRNRDTGEWRQANGSFAAGYYQANAALQASGAIATDWDLQVTLPNGSYNVIARAIDGDGVRDPSAAVRPFVVQS